MDPVVTLFIAGFIIVALLIVGILIYSIKKAIKRTESFRLYAEEYQLDFFPKHCPGLDLSMQRFKLMQKGRGRNHYNIIETTLENYQAYVFDYDYSTGSGKNKNTHTQTVILLQSSNLSLPIFRMAPEGFFSRIGTFLGMQDIDFEHRPDFSESYILKGENEQEIRNVFTNEILKYFESHKRYYIEGNSDALIIYRTDNTFQPAYIPDNLKLALTIAVMFEKQSN